MKKLKMIYGWLLLSLILQLAVLSFVNFVYLPGRGTVKATAFEANAAALKNRSYKLPQDAKDITASYDGTWIAFVQKDSIVIVDLDKKKKIKTIEPNGGAFSYFRWLPDRDMVIYAESKTDGKSGSVLISTYDTAQELVRSYPEINKLPAGSSVVKIELSPLTNVVYPMIKVSESGVKLYKFDIMDNLKMILSSSTGMRIQEMMYSDTLVYQVKDGKIKIRNGKTGRAASISVKDAEVLLAVDDNDYIYAAQTDQSGRLTGILYGKENQKASGWETVTPEKPISVEDLFITAEGGLYAADRTANEVIALEGTKKTAFKGTLLDVLDNYAVSVENQKVYLQILQK